ncbi:hypothetical protein BJ878DRAFT_479373 [Calycina marina]|uniref:Uncharacterized protein n=1 Tax=Calycina marina TaxID=1763456 RepID=A0A9P7Z5I6_9HELO|nr:hypothetical protein BJ878DRAFT_479373 [Calycina marina]
MLRVPGSWFGMLFMGLLVSRERLSLLASLLFFVQVIFIRLLVVFWMICGGQIPLLGAAVCPIIGEFMAARTTCRWTFWSTSIFRAVMVFVSLFGFHESSSPLILRRRAAEYLRKELRDSRYYAMSERDEGQSKLALVQRALTRLIRILLYHPIIQISSVLSGINYGIA